MTASFLKYIPLRNFSSYSLLSSMMKVPTLIEKALQYQWPALGLADKGNMFGAMEFSLSAYKQGIQPLIGCQLTCMFEEVKGILVLYVQNQKGYKNLAFLSGLHSKKGYITSQDLKDYTQGLLCLSGGEEGLIVKFLEKNKNLDPVLSFYDTHFSHRWYMEVSRTPQPIAQEEAMIDVAYTQGIPLIATNPAYFLQASDYESYHILRCIDEGKYISDEIQDGVCKENFLKSSDTMEKLFHFCPEALEQTLVFAQRCHFVLQQEQPKLPHYACTSEKDELWKQANVGLHKRLQGNITPVYKERLKYEYDVIAGMGFSGYFLIVADFILWAKSQNIPVGPGRGSGASSLIAWSLGITDVDPIQFQLLFERFLNPQRVSMPDFDVDFCQDRRDEVIEYVKEKYTYVSHIITFGTLQARAVLRDVGRVLHMPYGQVDKICKMIPFQPANPLTLEEAIAKEPQLQEEEKNNPDVKKLLRIGRKLEGLYRHASTHAAGVVIRSKDQVVPLYYDERWSIPATQFSMKFVELAGLIKFDFLGLKTLTMLQKIVDMLKEKNINITLSGIPLDDKKTFHLLQRAETVGLFQLESAGMTEVLHQLQPTSFQEIIALVALYRPGPMDDIPTYIACRHQREKVEYPYPVLEPILKETFGVMVYQEQVLQIAQVLAGYSLGEADLLRRAMGKKIPKEMAQHRDKFVEGVLKHHQGVKETAEKLFDQIAKFAGYAFPKAHATPYALLSYQTAYFKANYPDVFMAAIMTLDQNNTDKLAIFAKELKRMHIPLRPPHMGVSQASFTAVEYQNKPAVLYGLSALKNVGEAAVDAWIAQRPKRITHLQDFVGTLPKSFNKRSWESLVAAGALDFLEKNRRVLWEHGLHWIHTKAQQGTSLFEEEDTPLLPEENPWSHAMTLEKEWDAIGFYLSGHPLEPYTNFLTQQNIMPWHVGISHGKESVMVCGVLTAVKEKLSKTGKKYAILSFSDPSGTFDIHTFGEKFHKLRHQMYEGHIYCATVSLRYEQDTVRATLQNLRTLSQMLRDILTTTVHLKHLTPGYNLIKSLIHPEGQTQLRIKYAFTYNNQSYYAIFRLKHRILWTIDHLNTWSQQNHVTFLS